jgi:hypothetical protein
MSIRYCKRAFKRGHFLEEVRSTSRQRAGARRWMGRMLCKILKEEITKEIDKDFISHMLHGTPLQSTPIVWNT